jgi:hypothetical protein
MLEFHNADPEPPSSRYRTAKVTVALCWVEPAVAVTVIV